MCREIVLLIEGLLTKRTFERFLAGVRTNVSLKVVGLTETFATDLTAVRFLTCMNFLEMKNEYETLFCEF